MPPFQNSRNPPQRNSYGVLSLAVDNGGIIKVHDDVVVMPSGRQSTVKAIWGPGGAELDEAAAPAAVTIALNDEIDIVRGEMIARPGNRPHQGTELEAMVY